LNYVVNFLISLIVSLSVVAGYAFFLDRHYEEHFYVLDMKKVVQSQLDGKDKQSSASGKVFEAQCRKNPGDY